MLKISTISTIILFLGAHPIGAMETCSDITQDYQISLFNQDKKSDFIKVELCPLAFEVGQPSTYNFKNLKYNFPSIRITDKYENVVAYPIASSKAQAGIICELTPSYELAGYLWLSTPFRYIKRKGQQILGSVLVDFSTAYLTDFDYLGLLLPSPVATVKLTSHYFQKTELVINLDNGKNLQDYNKIIQADDNYTFLRRYREDLSDLGFTYFGTPADSNRDITPFYKILESVECKNN